MKKYIDIDQRDNCLQCGRLYLIINHSEAQPAFTTAKGEIHTESGGDSNGKADSEGCIFSKPEIRSSDKGRCAGGDRFARYTEGKPSQMRRHGSQHDWGAETDYRGQYGHDEHGDDKPSDYKENRCVSNRGRVPVLRRGAANNAVSGD